MSFTESRSSQWLPAKAGLNLTIVIAVLVFLGVGGAQTAHAEEHQIFPAPGGIEPYSPNPSETQPFAACPPATKLRATCMSAVVPVEDGKPVAGPAAEGSGELGGLSPDDLQSAYNLPTEGGSGLTVAIVIAFDIPKAESDLAVYRDNYNLPSCTTANGCFKRVNQKGETKNFPEPHPLWSLEAALDLDMVSAACPECHILLVEADSNYFEDLGVAEKKAVALGADVVSNSWAAPETEDSSQYDEYFTAGTAPLLFASGDNGYGVEYPASASTVIAVGGTRLSRAENARGWTETAWSGAGSGCSPYEAKPEWQEDGCSGRVVADVAAVADPATPLSVYDSYEYPGWILLGGTSAATPLMAGVEALASPSFRAAGAKAFYDAGKGGTLFDVTEGENGGCGIYLCRAEIGYDGPTGWGTPDGLLSLSPARTEPATIGSSSEAVLHGTVNPSEKATTYQFEYGTTSSYGSKAPASAKGVGSGAEDVSVSESISGLKGGTVYHFRLVAKNSAGTFHGVDRVFGTTPPTVATSAAGGITGYGASLHATLNPEGLATKYRFEYGRTSSYGHAVSATFDKVEGGTSSLEITKQLEALEPSTTYHYRIMARSIAGTVYGDDKTLTTSAADWSAQSTPNPYSEEEESPYAVLQNVSCGSPADCMAVGKTISYSPEHPFGQWINFSEHWDGASWSVVPMPRVEDEVPGITLFENGQYIYDVSCVSETWCVAVGEAEVRLPTRDGLVVIDYWDGTKWTMDTVTMEGLGRHDRSSLESVSCVAEADCFAVGYEVRPEDEVGGPIVPMALSLRWNGEEWSRAAVPAPGGGTAAAGLALSCASETSCIMSGIYRHPGESIEPNPPVHALTSRWDGKVWSTLAEAGDVRGISCVEGGGSLPVCLSRDGKRFDGSQWSPAGTMPTPGELSSNRPSRAACAGPSACTVVGGFVQQSDKQNIHAFAANWNGDSWSRLATVSSDSEQEATPAGGELVGVDCPALNRCIAVGYRVTEGGEWKTLAESYEPAVRPSPLTAAATAVTDTQATLNGTVNPEGSATSYQFEYGKTTAYGTKVPIPAKAIGSGTSDVSVSQSISGLVAGSTYHFRVVAESSAGKSYGEDRTLKALLLPQATTKAASGVGKGVATLNGTVNPEGSATSYQFEYGKTTAYGTKVPIPAKAIGSGTSDVSVSQSISGLPSGTTLHFRVVASSSDGTAYGSDLSFTTPSSWTVQAVTKPSGSINPGLSNISCASASECVAAGSSENEAGESLPFAETLKAGKWSVQALPLPEGFEKLSTLEDVSCASAESCMAVGSYSLESGYVPFAESWNGSEWSVQSLPQPEGTLYGSTLASVSCTAPDACTAVGLYFPSFLGAEPVVQRWDGSEWTTHLIADPEDKILSSVSCGSVEACMAVGRINSGEEEEALAERWDGSEWIEETMPEPAGVKSVAIYRVSCPSSSSCIAVGVSQNGSGAYRPYVVTWDGEKWSARLVDAPVGVGTYANLYGVSCTAPNACTAVGQYNDGSSAFLPFAETWDGSDWAVQTMSKPTGSSFTYLTGVSCVGSEACSAAGGYVKESVSVEPLVETRIGP